MCTYIIRHTAGGGGDAGDASNSMINRKTQQENIKRSSLLEKGLLFQTTLLIANGYERLHATIFLNDFIQNMHVTTSQEYQLDATGNFEEKNCQGTMVENK